MYAFRSNIVKCKRPQVFGNKRRQHVSSTPIVLFPAPSTGEAALSQTCGGKHWEALRPVFLNFSTPNAGEFALSQLYVGKDLGSTSPCFEPLNAENPLAAKKYIGKEGQQLILFSAVEFAKELRGINLGSVVPCVQLLNAQNQLAAEDSKTKLGSISSCFQPQTQENSHCQEFAGENIGKHFALLSTPKSPSARGPFAAKIS